MKVLCIKENDDGSAVVELDITEEEKDLLIEVGFNKMLRDGIKVFDDELKRKSTESGE